MARELVLIPKTKYENILNQLNTMSETEERSSADTQLSTTMENGQDANSNSNRTNNGSPIMEYEKQIFHNEGTANKQRNIDRGRIQKDKETAVLVEQKSDTKGPESGRMGSSNLTNESGNNMQTRGRTMNKKKETIR